MNEIRPARIRVCGSELRSVRVGGGVGRVALVSGI